MKTRTHKGFIRGVVSDVSADFMKKLFQNVPTRLIDFAIDQTTVTLTLTSGQYSNEPNFHAFMAWFFKTPEAKKIRNIKVDHYRNEDWERVEALGPDQGKYYFRFKGRLYWFERETQKMPNETVNLVRISTYGRQQEPLIALLNEFRVRNHHQNRIYSYSWRGDGWGNQTVVAPRDLETVAIDKDVLASITNAIDEFKAGREWYRRTGIPYKLVIMLYGPPGTGKTSLTRAIATKYKANINRLSPSGLTEEQLFNAVSSVQAGDILFMDDFNANGDFCIREGMEQEAAKMAAKRGESERETSATAASNKAIRVSGIADTDEKAPGKENLIQSLMRSYGMGSLQGFLTAIDGVVPLDDVIIIMTTNTIDKIDPSCLRWGRVDVTVKIPHLNDRAIREYIERMWPGQSIPQQAFADIPGCELAEALSVNRYDYNAFIRALPLKQP